MPKKIFKTPLSYAAILLIFLIILILYQNSQLNKIKEQVVSLTTSSATLQSQVGKKFSDIVNQWRPVVAYVVCNFKNSEARTGSGLLSKYPLGQTSLITNKHIVIDDLGHLARQCVFFLPDRNVQYTISTIKPSTNVDFAILSVANLDEYLEQLTSKVANYKICGRVFTFIGDSVLVLGYPVNGSKGDITATEGIISGYDGNYYITSAKIEHGNSGGIAILQKENCYVGIPSYVNPGSLDSLARILDMNTIFNSQF